MTMHTVSQFASALGQTFLVAHQRLFHVIVPPHVYGQTLALVRALNETGPVRRPVWIFAEPFLGPSRGWPARAAYLARSPGSLPAPPTVEAQKAPPPRDPCAAFAAELALYVKALGVPASPVVILAPQHIDDPRAYASDIDALLQNPSLASVRWLVVDAAHGSLGDLVDRLGVSASRIVLPEADLAFQNALGDVLDDLTSGSARLPAELDERIAADSALRGQEAEFERQMLRKAAAEAAAGRPDEAARIQMAAAGNLAALGLHEEAVHVKMECARSVLAAGSIDQGQQIFAQALQEAERRGMHALIPEAYASLGALHVRHQRYRDAMLAYERAATGAERRGSRELAADMYRCAGHASLNVDEVEAAMNTWTRAFVHLGKSPPVVAGLEEPQQLIILALALADAFEAHGNLAAAHGLRGHAATIERRNPRSSQAWS
jgi:tetratricopeptide (TPR) repeat protein